MKDARPRATGAQFFMRRSKQKNVDKVLSGSMFFCVCFVTLRVVCHVFFSV